MNEAEAIVVVCALLGGEAEVTHHYIIDEGPHFIRVDCETPTHAIEVGLDKRSSLDSVQQAEFAGWLAGKDPMVVLIDTDGREGPTEYRVKTTARRLGVEYVVFSDAFLVRWRMTSYFRERR